MSRRQLLIGLGVASAAAGIAVAAYAFLQERKRKQLEEDGELDRRGGHVSSRQTSAQMKIPERDAGLIIGRRGENVKELERRTSTRIHFMDERRTLLY